LGFFWYSELSSSLKLSPQRNSKLCSGNALSSRLFVCAQVETSLKWKNTSKSEATLPKCQSRGAPPANIQVGSKFSILSRTKLATSFCLLIKSLFVSIKRSPHTYTNQEHSQDYY